MSSALGDKCLARALDVRDGAVACRIIEADPGATSCRAAQGRLDVDAALVGPVRNHLDQSALCEGAGCESFQLCELEPFAAGSAELDACLETEQPVGNGWCYIDPAQGLGSMTLVERCPAAQRRRIRFAGSAAPNSGAVTLLLCE
jgi:hypothetical protein